MVADDCCKDGNDAVNTTVLTQYSVDSNDDPVEMAEFKEGSETDDNDDIDIPRNVTIDDDDEDTNSNESE